MDLHTVWLSPIGDLIVVWPYGVQWKTISLDDLNFSRRHLRFYKRWLKAQGYEYLGKL